VQVEAFKVITEVEDYAAVLNALAATGLGINSEVSIYVLVGCRMYIRACAVDLFR
jgi:hypothetical protein